MTRPTGLGARPALAVIGAGRAGSAIATAAYASGYRIAAVYSRTPRSSQLLADAVDAPVVDSAEKAAAQGDLILVTVPDMDIRAVATQIAASGVHLDHRVAVHCSASLGLEALEALRECGAAVGALHPLQALAGASSAGALRGSGFALVADPSARELLGVFVDDLGGVLLPIDGVDRRLYHAAAVIAGAAPLALLADAVDLLVAAGIARAAAQPALLALLAGAVGNAGRVGPRAALTGPVVRGDTATVAGHIDALAATPEMAVLYRTLTREMLRLAGTDGRGAIAALVADNEETRA